MKKIEKEFELVNTIINRHWERAVGLANAESLMTYWAVGAFVSSRLKSAVWGSKVVEALSDYLKTRNPKLRGFSKRQIYYMIDFYEAYTSIEFANILDRLRLDEFVQTASAQIAETSVRAKSGAIVQVTNAQSPRSSIVQTASAQLADKGLEVADFPMFLTLTTFSNHIEILNCCVSMEERVFYVLYSARERLKYRELQRSIASQTFDMVMSKEKKVSPRLKVMYPGADFLLKDKVFLDFLRLPARHTETVLHRKLVQHMKEFVLEMGKDFLYMGDEYHVHVGGENRRLDLLFYHRGLRCLVDVELKSVPFEPEHVGKIDMYLEAIDREIRREGENPTIGLILCPKANACRVAYTLNRTMSPVMVAEYRRLLVPEEVMRKSLEEYCEFMKREAAKG